MLAEFMIVTIEDGNFKYKAYFQNRDMRACVRAYVRVCVRVCTCVARTCVRACVHVDLHLLPLCTNEIDTRETQYSFKNPYFNRKHSTCLSRETQYSVKNPYFNRTHSTLSREKTRWDDSMGSVRLQCVGAQSISR